MGEHSHTLYGRLKFRFIIRPKLDRSLLIHLGCFRDGKNRLLPKISKIPYARKAENVSHIPAKVKQNQFSGFDVKA